MLEVQSLVGYTSFNIPRRMSTGMDFNRVILLIAVLEKRAGLQLSGYDAYVNITGGIRVGEPAIDAAVVAAVASSFKDKPVSEATYEIDGQLFTVTSHYVGEKSLDKELYRMAFERAYAETVEQV